MFNRIMISLVFTTGLCGAWALWAHLDTSVQKFHIKGDLTAREQLKISDALQELNLGGILSVDIARVRAHLDEMGWAREVSVRRIWPATLEISLLKENPVAHWGEGVFVAASGNLLELPDAYPELPQFEVGVSSPREAMKVYRLVAHLAAESDMEVVALKQDSQGGWNVTFQNGMTIFLGADRLGERIQRFNKIYAQLGSTGREIAYMDLRYNNGAAVKHTEVEDEQVLVASHKPR